MCNRMTNTHPNHRAVGFASPMMYGFISFPPETMNPIMETSCLGFRVTLYPTRLVYNKVGTEERTILVKSIASVTLAMALVQKITIETTGGERIELVVRLKDKKKLRDAIYKAIDEIGA